MLASSKYMKKIGNLLVVESLVVEEVLELDDQSLPIFFIYKKDDSPHDHNQDQKKKNQSATAQSLKKNN